MVKNNATKTSPTLKLEHIDGNKPLGSELPLPVNRNLLIEIVKGPGAGQVYKLTSGTTIIGRKNADLVIDDDTISKKHAVIEAFSRDNIYIRDLASTNGTYVNGTQVVKKKLSNNTLIKIGAIELRFFFHDLSKAIG